MKIKLSSILVDNQEKSLKFYTEVLGFVKKTDVPVGEYRWLTVTSSDGSGLELLLEPNAHPASKVYQEALYRDGIPLPGGTYSGGTVSHPLRHVKSLHSL